jgi:hypothetical protein
MTPRAAQAIVAAKLGIAACAGTTIATLIYVDVARPSRGGEDYEHFASMMQAIDLVVWVSIASGVFALSLINLRLIFSRALERSDCCG